MRSPPDIAIPELDLLGWKRELFALYQRSRSRQASTASRRDR
jgi:hypothetical protein